MLQHIVELDLTATLTHVFDTVSGCVYNASNGRFGSASIAVQHNNLARRTLVGNPMTVILQFAVYREPHSAGSQWVRLLNGGDRQFELMISTADGSMRFQRNGSTVSGASTENIPAAEHTYIEWKTYVDASGAPGTSFLRMNGVEVLSFSGSTRGQLTTGVTSWDFQCPAQGPSAAGTFRYSHIICMDDTGAVMNDFIGDKKLIVSLPSADTAAKDWSRSAGADNYALVDEVPPDEDTSYVHASGDGDKDLYAYPALPAGTQNIEAVINVMRVRKDDAGTIEVRALVSSNSVEAAGASADPPSGYAYRSEPFYVDPDTTAAWTPAAVNAALLGQEIVEP